MKIFIRYRKDCVVEIADSYGYTCYNFWYLCKKLQLYDIDIPSLLFRDFVEIIYEHESD